MLEEFLGPSEFENHGERVVTGQRLMQAAQRHLPRLAARRVGNGRPAARLLRPSAEGLEGLGGNRADGPEGHGRLRPALRLDARPRPRAQRRPHRDRRIPRQGPTSSTARSSSSPTPTPSRTSATTGRSRRRSSPVAWSRRPDSETSRSGVGGLPRRAAPALGLGQQLPRLAAANSSSLIAPRSCREARRSISPALEAPCSGAAGPRRWPTFLAHLAARSRRVVRIDTACASGNSCAIWVRRTWVPASVRTVNRSIHHGLLVAGIGDQMNSSASSPSAIQ